MGDSKPAPRRRLFSLPPLAAVLLAGFPLIALWAENIGQHVRLRDLWFPALLSAAIAFVTWFAGGLVTGNASRRTLLTALWVCAILYYGVFFHLLTASPLAALAQHSIALAACAVAVLGSSWYVVRSRRKLERASRFVLAFSILLVLQGLSKAGWGWATQADPGTAWTGVPTVDGSRADYRPDIYFLVLDKYTGSSVLAESFGFDNGWIEDELKQRGFSVPGDPQANYVYTFLSLASMLNWIQGEDIVPALVGHRSTNRAALTGLIESNRAVHYLRSLGYRIIHFNTTFPPTASNRFADLEIPGRPTRSPSVLRLGFTWAEGTLLAAVLPWMCRRGCVDLAPIVPESAEEIESKFMRLAELPDSTGPLFAFAHFMVPHEPYLFDASCRHRAPYWPVGHTRADESRARRAYVEQIQCVNRMVLSLVDTLLERSETPPVIVIQSDHGHGATLPRQFYTPLDDLTESQIRQRTSVFAAYYIPGAEPTLFPDTITPVNVLPIIFNHLFDAGVPLAEDATYWSDFRRPYDLRRVQVSAKKGTNSAP